MLPQFSDQLVLVDICFAQVQLKLLVKLGKLLPIFDHNVDRLVLHFLRGLQLGGVFRQDANAVLRIFIIVESAIDDATYEADDYNQNIYFQHLDDAFFLQNKPKRTADNANENHNRLVN